jgi:hypothetical protein
MIYIKVVNQLELKYGHRMWAIASNFCVLATIKRNVTGPATIPCLMKMMCLAIVLLQNIDQVTDYSDNLWIWPS